MIPDVLRRVYAAHKPALPPPPAAPPLLDPDEFRALCSRHTGEDDLDADLATFAALDAPALLALSTSATAPPRERARAALWVAFRMGGESTPPQER